MTAEATAATGPSTAQPPALELRGVTKRFGPVVACDAVDFAVQRGQIHGLLGQNGAGKTTLMRVVLGLVTPDAGQVFVEGEPAVITDPIRAAELGIAMEHQHFSVIGAHTVWENVARGERGRVDRDRVVRLVREIGERYGLAVDPNARINDLTTGQKQRVEIIKALRRDPRVLILDEPTSVLTLAESHELFNVLRSVVRDEDRAVVLISHKLDEILHATDCVTVMRAGAVVARRTTAETNMRELARELVGREVSLRSEAAALGVVTLAAETAAASATPAEENADDTREVRLRIRDAWASAPDGRPLLQGLNLEVRSGEILGIAGVEGNGQSALGDLLSSLLELSAGQVEVCGRAVPAGRPGSMKAAGLAVIPEDRHTCGCVLGMSVAENLAIADLKSISPGALLKPRELRKHAARLMHDFDITAASPDAPMRSLSGGNQQRVVVARELASNPKVLVAAQPTRGLDVGAVEYMSARLREAAASGVAVLLISTELEEILALSSRVAVMHRGRIVGEMTRSEVDLERLGMMMGGQAA